MWMRNSTFFRASFIVSLIVLLFLEQIPFSHAQQQEKESNPLQVAQAHWLKFVEPAIQKEVCSSAFLNCYNLKAEKCSTLSKSALNKCIVQQRLPLRLDPKEEGIVFAEKIAKCTVESLEIKLKTQRGSDAVCGQEPLKDGK